MRVDVDTGRGQVVIRDAKAELNLTLDVWVTPKQARILADNLDSEGNHTAADSLRQAADSLEKAS